MVARTVDRVAAELAGSGLPPRRDVLVHASLRAIDAHACGPDELLSAIRAVIGPDAAIVVPTHTPTHSRTSRQFSVATAGLSDAEIAQFEARFTGFDPAVSASEGMGVFAEWVRTQPGASRSRHPLTSFAAVGPHAVDILRDHETRSLLGERSPLGALYRRDAVVLLLGVGFGACTALHLAEHRLPWGPRTQRYTCYLRTPQGRQVCEFIGVQYDESDFGRLGESLDRQPFVRKGQVGRADVRVLPIRGAVDFGVEWMRRHRTPVTSDGARKLTNIY